MNSLLTILGPIIIIGIILSGGLVYSPKTYNAKSLPGIYKLSDSAENPENPTLQLDKLNFSPVTVPKTNNDDKTGQDCGGDVTKTGGCICKAVPAESDGIVCDIATDEPSTFTQRVLPPGSANSVVISTESPKSCPDGGIPCIVYTLGNNASSDNYRTWNCTDNSCIYIKDNVSIVAESGNPNFDKYKDCEGGHAICFAKPVIYLYPETDTLVDVNLSIPGIITKSIPEYKDGWFDVLAHPDGKLEYHGQNYSELFYETQVENTKTPDNGILIAKTELQPKLTDILKDLGLNRAESQEFLDYWLPQLRETKGDYIIFSLIEKSEKERVDGIHIIPEPDTRIEFLAYFKPSFFPVFVKPLELPTPPKRVGFTEVEWGGTISQ